MRLPLSLIRSFIDLDIPVQTIANTLTLLGIEVDGILNEHPPFSGVVVAEVVSVRAHPKSDRLQIAEVFDGEKKQEVVCGAPNCRAGIKTAFARVGALLTDGEGRPSQIQKASLRGVDSFGMLCSADELHLWDASEGILELPLDWKTGADLVPLLWDPVFELSFTPNLGHALSAFGVARELSAALQKPLKKEEARPHALAPHFEIVIEDPKLCPHYSCSFVEGVKIAPSPFWLQKILLLCGHKSISNAVDITNFIRIKWGQPLHCFDADLLEGKKLRVGLATRREKFVSLDGVERDIAPNTLLISDAKKPVAIAGVIGGQNSAVSETTQNILIEAAFFDPMTVRKSAKNVSVRTDSVWHFEKGVDPNGVQRALDDAAHLMATLCHGHLALGAAKPFSYPAKLISCRPERVNQVLGTQLSQTEIREIFHRLGFAVEEKEALLVKVPAFRFDIAEEIDLIEEVARIYGYNHIEKRVARFASSQVPEDRGYLFETQFRLRCVGLGLQELLTADLVSPKLAQIGHELAGTDLQLLKAIHAKTEEYSVLRPSLLPGLLQVAKTNLDQKNPTLSGFEIGRIHFLQKGQLIEIPMGALLLFGKSTPLHWAEKQREFDFFDLKGILESLFTALHIPNLSWTASNLLSFHPLRQAHIFHNGIKVGSVGEVHPHLLAKFDIKQKVLFAELNLQLLQQLQTGQIHMSPLAQFPSSERDVTLSLSTQTPIESIFAAARKMDLPLLEKIELIDLYHPEGASHKNATFRLTYRDPLKTVSFEEVETAHQKWIESIKCVAK